MKFFDKMRKCGIRIAAIIFCCCVSMLFAVNIRYAVTAEEAAGEGTETVEPVGHRCAFFTSTSDYAVDLGGVDSQAWAVLVGNYANAPEDYFVADYPACAYLCLTENITWDETVYIPQNLHIGICLNGYSLDCDFQYSTKGECGVYVFDCSDIHACEVVAEDTIYMPALNQDIVDFMPYWAMARAGVPSMSNMYVALSEDVTFGKYWKGFMSDGDNLTICLNGNRVINSETLTINGGNLTLIDCQPDKPCNYFVGNDSEDSRAIDLGTYTASEFADFVASINAFDTELTEKYAVHFSLKGSVTSSETIVIPENVYLAVCTNGYKMNAKVQLPESGNGGFYTLDCASTHDCKSAFTTVPYISQDLIDFLPIWSACGGAMGTAFNTTAVALASDVTFGSAWQGYGEGMNISICTCGFEVSNTNIFAGSVAIVNCSNDEVCRVCNPLSGVKSISLFELPDDTEGLYVEEILQKGSSTEVITKKAIDCFTSYTDENGVFIGDGSGNTKYMFTLQSDIKLAKTLVIPEGMEVHICLNGYSLEGPRIIFYKEKPDVIGVFTIEYGGSLSIHDCSAAGTGTIITGIKDAIAETEEGWDFSGLSVLVAFSVTNAGSFTMNGGNMASMIGVLNLGDVTINGGNIGGALAGIVDATSIGYTGVVDVASTPTVTMNGGSVSSALAGIAMSTGEVVLNGGEIRSLYTGVALGVNLNEESVKDADASLTINGGTINYSESVAEVFIATGLTDALKVDIQNMKDTLVVEDTIAIYVNGTVEMNGDFEVVYSELFLEAQERAAAEDTQKRQDAADANLAEGEESTPVEPTEYLSMDFMLIDGATIDVSENANLEDEYLVSTNKSGLVIATGAESGTFVAPKGYATVFNANDELIFVNLSEFGLTALPAKVAGATASTSGLIMLNFYVQFDAMFLNNPDARVLIKTPTKTYSYTVAQGTKSGSYYIYSIGISAKDYKQKVTCAFSMPVQLSNDSPAQTFTWHGYDCSIEYYLNYLLSQSNEKVRNVAAAMLDYCMTASVHFGTSEEYSYTEGMQEVVADVDLEALAPYKPLRDTERGEHAKIAGTTLFLQSATTLRIYFVVDAGVDISMVSCTIDGKSITPTHYSGYYYYVEITNISAKDLGTAHEINIDGDIMVYSAMSYTYQALAKRVESTELTAAKMLYLYYKAAVAYSNR